MSTSRPKLIEIGSEEAVWEWQEKGKWVKMDQNAINLIETAWQRDKNAIVQVSASNYVQYKM